MDVAGLIFQNLAVVAVVGLDILSYYVWKYINRESNSTRRNAYANHKSYRPI